MSFTPVLREPLSGAELIRPIAAGDNAIASGAILSGHIASGQIGPNHLANQSVQSGQIASGIIGSVHIASGTVVAADIGSGAIGSGQIQSGAVQGSLGTTPNIVSGTVGPNDIGSGAVRSGHIASGSIHRFSMASGAITSGHIGDAAVVSGSIASGSIGPTHLGSGAVTSGAIASGAIGQGHLQSGIVVTQARLIIDDFSAGGTPLITEENVSGFVAVHLTQSGRLRIAMPGVSGRMPAIGIAVSGVLSGLACSFWTDGFLQVSSGMVNFSGFVGQPLYVARSGQVGPLSGGFLSGGFASGDLQQRVGVSVNSGAIRMSVDPFAKGATQTAPATSWIFSGDVASGQLGSEHLAAAAVRNVNMGADAITASNIASGQVRSGKIGDASVTSGSIASGAVGRMHLASGAVNSGHIADNAVVSGSIASAAVGQMQIASGAVSSGRLGVTGAPNGTKFLRDDFSWQTAGGGAVNSGDIGSGKVASGTIGGFFGPTRHIQSGTVGAFDLGSGAVMANQIGSGVVTPYAATVAGVQWSTAEMISGGMCVAVASGGFLRVANPALSGAMPAVGIVTEDTLSGQPAPHVKYFGAIVDTRLPIYSFSSGKWNGPVYVGNSGQPSMSQPTVGGSIVQVIGNMDGADQEFIACFDGAASGWIYGKDFGSGVRIGMAASTVSFGYPAGELISGRPAICMVSGLAFIAKPNVPWKMPAIGIAENNVLSGQNGLNIVHAGDFSDFDGSYSISPLSGMHVYVSDSGFPTSLPPQLSGAHAQVIGLCDGYDDDVIITIQSFGSGSLGTRYTQDGYPVEFGSGFRARYGMGQQHGFYWAGEMISGGMCVTMTSGGWCFVANPADHSRMPAFAVASVYDTLSGQQIRQLEFGGYTYDPRMPVYWQSGHFIYVGESGQPSSTPPSTSGAIIQTIGNIYGTNDFDLNFAGKVGRGMYLSGSIGATKDANGIPLDFSSDTTIGGARGIQDQFAAGELISGGVCVHLGSGGYIFVANPAIPSRMPAFGTINRDILSGQNTFDYVVQYGYNFDTRFPIYTASGRNLPIYVGASGQPTQVPPAVGIVQEIGSQYGDNDFYWHVPQRAAYGDGNFTLFQAAETISGSFAQAAALTWDSTRAGKVVQAKSENSGRYPAIGAVIDDVLSGEIVKVYHKGVVRSTKFNNTVGVPVILDQLGRLISSTGTASGRAYQSMGVALDASGVFMHWNARRIGEAIVGFAQIASGSITPNSFGSGAIQSGDIGLQAVHSGNMDPNFISNLGGGSTQSNGLAISFVARAGEAISGVKAVTWVNDPAQSFSDQRILISMPDLSGRAPCVGVVVDNVVSGANVRVYTHGIVYLPNANSGSFSGALDIGWGGRMPIPAYVNISGNITKAFNAAPVSAIVQTIGWFIAQSGSQDFIPQGLLLKEFTGSGTVGANQIYAVGPNTLVSGAINDTTMIAGNVIASGTIRSGAFTEGAKRLVHELDAFAGETISGAGDALYAVCSLNDMPLSGQFVVGWARGEDNSRQPALGVILTKPLSGDPVKVVTHGMIQVPGSVGQGGQIIYLPTSGSTVGQGYSTTSGRLKQPIGFVAARGVNSGSIVISMQPFDGSTVNNPSLGYVGFQAMASGAILVSNVICDNVVNHLHLASGSVISSKVLAQSIGAAHFNISDPLRLGSYASGSIRSGDIASGHIGTNHLTSGIIATYARADIDDTFVATETISGGRCVQVIGSGFVRIAMAAVSGRMPAIGVCLTNVLSGSTCTFVYAGRHMSLSGQIGSGFAISGRWQSRLWVGASGQIVTISGGGPTVGIAAGNSGAMGQIIGQTANSGMLWLQMGEVMYSGAAVITTDTRFWPL